MVLFIDLVLIKPQVSLVSSHHQDHSLIEAWLSYTDPDVGLQTFTTQHSHER